jgi:hypothetical protein
VTDQELDVVARAVQRAVDASEARMKAEIGPRPTLTLKALADGKLPSHDALADMMIGAVKSYVQRHAGELAKRLDKIEARRTMVFCGPFDPSAKYAPGDVTQKSNHVFVALVETQDPPGNSDAWRRLA